MMNNKGLPQNIQWVGFHRECCKSLSGLTPRAVEVKAELQTSTVEMPK